MHCRTVGDIAIAAGVALIVLVVGGFISMKTLKKIGIILTAAVALITFLTLLGL